MALELPDGGLTLGGLTSGPVPTPTTSQTRKWVQTATKQPSGYYTLGELCESTASAENCWTPSGDWNESGNIKLPSPIRPGFDATTADTNLQSFYAYYPRDLNNNTYLGGSLRFDDNKSFGSRLLYHAQVNDPQYADVWTKYTLNVPEEEKVTSYWPIRSVLDETLTEAPTKWCPPTGIDPCLGALCESCFSPPAPIVTSTSSTDTLSTPSSNVPTPTMDTGIPVVTSTPAPVISDKPTSTTTSSNASLNSMHSTSASSSVMEQGTIVLIVIIVICCMVAFVVIACSSLYLLNQK